MFSTLLSALCIFAATSSLAAPAAEPRATCNVLSPGRYTISSAANNWQLRPYSEHIRSPPGIGARKEPPTGDNGVWLILSASESAYHMINVGQGNVFTFTTSPPRPFASFNAPRSRFAIECAGDGHSGYIIKNPDADEVWTALPDTYVEMIGANGDIFQRFEFTEA